jgi:hypothetical protein
MDNRSWIFKVSSKRLQRMKYCNRIKGFINYTLSNPRNISRNGIRCPWKRCKNKKFIDPDVVTMHFFYQKRYMEKYLFWFAHREPYVPYETKVKRMVGSTPSSSNVHGVVDDNSNSYRNMVIDVMRMN